MKKKNMIRFLFSGRTVPKVVENQTLLVERWQSSRGENVFYFSAQCVKSITLLSSN